MVSGLDSAWVHTSALSAKKDLGLQFNVNSQLELVLISVTGGLVGVALGELDMTNNHLDEVMTAMMNK
jgi:hypothetical protein